MTNRMYQAIRATQIALQNLSEELVDANNDECTEGYPFEKSFDEVNGDMQNWLEKFASKSELIEYKRMVEEHYVPTMGASILVEDTIVDKKIISVGIVGFYYGGDDEEARKQYYGKLRADFEGGL